VVLKELVDNALDACESVGVAPEVEIEAHEGHDMIELSVTDNAAGIPPDVVRKAADFGVTVSDKAMYRSPTRGAQGNALQTVLSIPPALGSVEPIVIEARGIRHELRPWVDPFGELRVQHDEHGIAVSTGTRVSVVVPRLGQLFDPYYWARAFAVFNPHASVKISTSGPAGYPGDRGLCDYEDSYLPTQTFPGEFKKYLPTDATSPHWYDEEALRRLIYAHIAHSRSGAPDVTLREFVRQFKGLSGTAKVKQVCSMLPKISTLSDLEGHPDRAIGVLLEAMCQHASAPSHGLFGTAGDEHLAKRFGEFYGGVERFGYRKVTGQLPSGQPYVFEFALAETWARTGELFTGVNYSPTFSDPLADVRFSRPEYAATGIEAFLEQGFVHPTIARSDDPDYPLTAAAVHIITPAPLFLDRGKTRLQIGGC
jgi:hypothetical protein